MNGMFPKYSRNLLNSSRNISKSPKYLEQLFKMLFYLKTCIKQLIPPKEFALREAYLLHPAGQP